VWDDGDRFGCLNLLTPERAVAAARSVRTGRSFPLNLALTEPDPPLFGRPAVRLEVSHAPGPSRDDVVHDLNTQSSSQWDGFGHFGHRTHGHYGGLGDDDHGIERWAQRGIVGRAILADVARWRTGTGRPLRHGEADPILTSDLDACLEEQGTPLEPGDILLIRTGWTEWHRGLDDAGRIACAASGAAPGIAGKDLPRWLWDHHLAAVACDNPSVEMIPPTRELGVLHPQALALLGLPLGELWDLEALAADCASTGTADSMLVSAPLHLPGAVSSPANAVAIR
jgi:kynurenine formamidase